MPPRCLLVAAIVGCPLTGLADGNRRIPRLYVRGVVSHVDPRITTHDVQLEPTGLARAAIEDGHIEDAGVAVDAAMGPTAIVGYVLPFLRGRLAIETVIGIPVAMKIEATGKLATESLAPEAAGIPTGIPPLGRDLAEATIAPPMLTAIYRPLQLGPLAVFGGIGASILFVYSERITNPVLTEVAEPELSISHAFGVVLQTGLEARLWRRVVARVDAKYIAYGESDATIEHIAVRTDLPNLPTIEVGSATMGVSARPIIVQIGIGADF